MTRALWVAIAMVSPSVHAQSIQVQAQAAINTRGHSCAAVTTVRPLGTIDDGTPLVAAYCSDGKGHVLKITPRDTLEYLTTCAAYNAASRRSSC